METEATEKPKSGKRYSNALGNTRGHNRLNGRNRKDTRREEAFARLEAFDKLSLKQKLETLPVGGANRQRARYTALLEAKADKEKASQTAKKDKKVKNEA